MRLLAAILISLVCAAPSAGQWQPAPAVPSPIMPAPLPRAVPVMPAPYGWHPTADYIEPGQDEPGYRAWVSRLPWRAGWVSQFHRYLEASGVSYVAPTWQLLRTASDWRRCGAEPFEVPPAEEWANIVNTLRYVRDYVVPAIGPVEPVSVFRNAVLNRCAGGAPESVHQSMSAIDFVPLAPIGRDAMIRRLCTRHQAEGPRFSAGLGFYTKMRFHVDSWRYRTWGRDDRGDTACPKVEIAPPPVLASASPGAAAPSQPAAAPVQPPAAATPAPAPSALPPAATTTRPPAEDPLAPLR